ncbi:MAG TPA: type II toxin-antitoxin system HicA family toxin [Dehalococcoidia bacterium]|nr:type II toxin-antitoxin system HicA family toxin [Dehalococcoidia bacterium]
MPQLDKLVGRLRARPPEASFADVHQLLSAYGWSIANEKGSHVTFRKAGELPLVVVKLGGRKVKRTYIARVLERIGLDE